MTKIKLTPTQRLELENAEKQLRQPQLLKRIQGIKLRDKGLSNIEIGDFLLMSDQTVSNWVQAYFKNGLKGLLEWNYKGRVSILTLEQQQELKERNEKQAFTKASEAKEYIKEHFEINFHLHWVQKLMKKNLSLHTRKHN